MNRKDALTRIAAVVTTLAETSGSPESALYIFCNMDIRAYETLRDILLKSGLVSIKGNFVTLTAEGQETAKRLNAAIAAKQ